MIRSSRLVAAAMVLVAAGTLGGCGQEGSSAKVSSTAQVSSTASAAPPPPPSVPVATPVAAGRISRPVMPRAARDNTSRGAIAMVVYYHRVVDYGYRTGDARPVLAEATADCSWCREIAANIRANAEAQTFALSPLNTARPVRALRYDARQYLVHIWHEVVPPGSKERVRGKVRAMRTDTHEKATWVLYYSGGRWHMQSLGGRWCSLADAEAGGKGRG